MPLDEEGDEFPEHGDLPQAPLNEDDPVDANVDTTTPSYGPEALSDAPPIEEPQAVIGEAPSPEGERAASEEADGIEPMPEFDPKMREAFEGMLFIGRLTREFKFLGHEFVIKTMTTDENLEVGLLQKPYRDSMGDLRAWTAAVVAACVVSVDGQPISLPLTNDPEDSGLVARFRYVRKNWFPVVLDRIYEEYLVLEATAQEVVRSMGEARG